MDVNQLAQCSKWAAEAVVVSLQLFLYILEYGMILYIDCQI